MQSDGWRRTPRTGSAHHWTSAIQRTASQQRWQETVHSRLQLRAELVRYDAKSGDFVPYLGGISAGDVDFSRDGQWVTYVSYPDDTLWRSKLDGSARLQLTYPPMRTALGHWSPDGQQIAFAGASAGQAVEGISHFKRRWQSTVLGFENRGDQETDPTWSPDGNTLAFGHSGFHPDPTLIELFNIKTHQISQLPGSEGFFGPRWSPDGRYIVALSQATTISLMLLRCERPSMAAVGHDQLNSFGYLAWSSRQRLCVFRHILKSDSGYYRLRISDAKLEKLADLK